MPETGGNGREMTKKIDGNLLDLLRMKFQDAGITIYDSRQDKQGNVEITLWDAEPETLFRARELVKPHQRGHHDLATDFYVQDNLDPKIPQAEYVMLSNHPSKRTSDQIQKFAQAIFPDFQETQLKMVQYSHDLFQGHLPQYWQVRREEGFAPRCTVCKGPVDDTKSAVRNRKEDPTTYRHTARGPCFPVEDSETEDTHQHARRNEPCSPPR